MAHLALGDSDALYYEFHEPGQQGRTFVFVNALTGNTGMWQAEIGPALRAAGYGSSPTISAARRTARSPPAASWTRT